MPSVSYWSRRQACADNCVDQFCERGWRGQSIFCTLHGPVDRKRIHEANIQSLKIMAGHGPLRSPGHESRTSQRPRQMNQSSVNAHMAR